MGRDYVCVEIIQTRNLDNYTYLDADIELLLLIREHMMELKGLLGPQLFIEWLYISGFITYKEFMDVSPVYNNKYKSDMSIRGEIPSYL